MPLTASSLRQDIYRLLDRVLETGIPLEVERHGQVLRIVPPNMTSKLERLQRRDYLLVEPEELVHVDWSDAWTP